MHRVAIIFFSLCLAVSAQIPIATQIKIVRTEDTLVYDQTLEALMNSPDGRIRARAALAAGRIGDEKAVPALATLLEKDASVEVRAMAAFALGETESMLAADPILKSILDGKTPDAVRARAIEAAGKIVGANAANGKSKMIDNLGEGILDVLREQDKKGTKQSREVVLAGLTAALRAHARARIRGLTKEEAEAVDTGGVVAKFLTNSDARIRADAANTISRARYKKANDVLNAMLRFEPDGAARANAARALGAADDRSAVDMLLEASIGDNDSRVRVSAIRSLGALKDTKAAGRLIERGEKLMSEFALSKLANPPEKNELLEIATVLGRLMQGTGNERTIKLLDMLRTADKYTSGETEIAFVRVSPEKYLTSLMQNPEAHFGEQCWATSATFQAIAEVANLEKGPENDSIKSQYRLLLLKTLGSWVNSTPVEKAKGDAAKAVPDMLEAFDAFEFENTSAIIRPLLEIEQDVFIRAGAAWILRNEPPSKENTEALKTAFNRSLLTDRTSNIAQLTLLDALFKVDKKEAVGTLMIALSAQDYMVRKKAMKMLEDKDLQKDFPGIPTSLENAKASGKDRPLAYNAAFGTKLGSVLNTTADYARAVSRKNGGVRAVVTTDKGTFTIEFFPEEAPLTVDNFVKLARAGYYNGVMFHRVVPNFVVQGGDPRGDGAGGPGWSIRCEINMMPYDRGAVGTALWAKDTEGSQWTVTPGPQPQEDGGYTVFGHVDDAGMKVVDNIVRSDKVISVKIIEGKIVKKPVK